ncbi:MAG: peptidyl-prolyl cis-trans isomerase [Magnetococcales bacterium]|nr:peptidyl-prolyl cis-trans isomerase [Magnetococcales bacterium]
MKKLVLLFGLVLALCTGFFIGQASAVPDQITSSKKGTKPMVLLSTSLGDIKIALDADAAPVTVANFLSYINDGFYNGTVFHRVIRGFMVQGGGMDANLVSKPTRAPIKNEADNGLRNVRGTIAMARTQVVNSATAQFFINLVDNAFLDNSSRDFGYAVFGHVVEGMDVIDRMAGIATGDRGGHQNVPLQPVTIVSAKVMSE